MEHPDDMDFIDKLELEARLRNNPVTRRYMDEIGDDFMATGPTLIRLVADTIAIDGTDGGPEVAEQLHKIAHDFEHMQLILRALASGELDVKDLKVEEG